MKLDKVNLSYWEDKLGEHVEGAINYIDDDNQLRHVHIHDDSLIKADDGSIDWGKVKSYLAGKGIVIKE